MPYTWLPSAYIYGFMGAHFSIQLALFLGPVFFNLFKILFVIYSTFCHSTH